MSTIRKIILGAAVVSTFGLSFCAIAQPEKHDILPGFQEFDVKDFPVDVEGFDTRIKILLFFSSDSSTKLAERLSALQTRFEKEKVFIVAVGVEDERDKLKRFAELYGVAYHVVPNTQKVDAEKKYGPFNIMPITYVASTDLKLIRSVQGGGVSSAKHIATIAEEFLKMGAAKDAEAAAELAIEEGEDTETAKPLLAYAKLEQGETEEASKLFDELSSASGKARVALEEGNVDEAIEIAKAAGPDDAYAAAVLGQALMTAGNREEALAAFNAAAAKSDGMLEFQAADALNGKGRLLHAEGNTAAAKESYELAHKASYFAVEPLTNLAAALQDEGETGSANLKESLEEAQEIIERAKQIAASTGREDALSEMIGRDIADALQSLADTQARAERAKRIQELGELYRKMKEEGRAEPADAWTSKRRVIAIVPPTRRSTVFFARAGTELAMRRSVERALQDHEAIEVVDRDELDGVLQEIQLSANDLTNDQTAIELGQLFNAGFLGYLEFMESLDGKGVDLNVKAVNTETTQVPVRAPIAGVDKADLNEAVAKAVDSFVEGIMAEPLRGRLVEVQGDDMVMIGLGSDYGVKPGMKFRIIVQGDPIVVRGKERPGPSKTVGLLEVTELLEGEGDLAFAKITQLAEGAEIGPETKIEEYRQ